MSAPRNVTIAAAAAAWLALGWALHERHAAGQAERAAAAVSRRSDGLYAELQGLRAERASRPSGSAPAVASAARAPAPAGGAALDPRSAEMIRRQAAKARASSLLRYGPLLRSLPVTPDVGQKIASLLQEYELKAREIWETANAQGLAADDAALWQLMRPDYDQLKAQVTALAGDAVFQQVDHYNKTLNARDFANGLYSALYFTDQPLTPAQAEQMVSVFAAQSPAYQNGHATTDLYSLDWNGIYPRLAGALSPAQITALRGVVDARQGYVRLTPLVGSTTTPTFSVK